MSIRAAAFSLLAALAASSAFSAERTNSGSIIHWSKPGHNIHRVEFSPDGRELLLDLRPYSRKAGSLPRDVDRANRKAGLYDPIVGVLTIADLRFVEIAHGRESRFSPDGRAVTFVAQANPAPYEDFERGDDLAGNCAAVYDRASGQTLALARPQWNRHTAPLFTPDGKRVTYVDLVYPNGILHTLLTEFDLSSRESRVLFEPPMVGATPARVVQYGHTGGRLLATLLMPQAATKVANEPVERVEQLVEIRDGKAIELFNWGKNDANLRADERLVILRDDAMTFADRWRPIGKEGGPGEPRGRVPADDELPGVPSPDGRLLARAVLKKDDGGTLYYAVTLNVEELDSGKVIAQFPLDKSRGIRDTVIAWSADSRQLAWPDNATGNWVENQDTLFVATLP